MQNRSWKSWARPDGWGCRKSFQHFRGTGTAFHDGPWFYGNKTTQALLTTDRFVLPQMFGKPGEMMWNAVSGVMSEPHHLSQPRHSLLFVYSTEVWCSIQCLKALIWTTSRRENSKISGQLPWFSQRPTLTRWRRWNPPGSCLCFLVPSLDPSGLMSTGRGKKGLVSPFPKINIQKTRRHKTRPNNAFWKSTVYLLSF